MRWLPSRRCLKFVGIVAGCLAVLAALPVLWIETRCQSERRQPSLTAAHASLLSAADRREEANSYLAYPKWSIVHAYEDLAAVTRRRSESSYDYLGAIAHYWSSLCVISQLASQRRTIATGHKVTLHVSGLRFTAEMAIKGLYEKTMGRITSLIRGQTRTPEDEFALALADDYANFLAQTPWYAYPFGGKLWRFWADTPLWGGNLVRKIERRVALTLEWGAKSIFAQLRAAGAAATPAPLRIKSVVTNLHPADLAADPRIQLVGMHGSAAIIETDRHSTFAAVMTGLAQRSGNLVEIAGNHNILVTVLAPMETTTVPESAALVLQVPVGARPGWQRLALDVKVPELLELLRTIQRSGLLLEHVYDY